MVVCVSLDLNNHYCNVTCLIWSILSCEIFYHGIYIHTWAYPQGSNDNTDIINTVTAQTIQSCLFNFQFNSIYPYYSKGPLCWNRFYADIGSVN